MKKTIAYILTLAMLATCPLTALAETAEANGASIASVSI